VAQHSREQGGVQYIVVNADFHIFNPVQQSLRRHRCKYDPSADPYDYALIKAATMNFVKSMTKQLGPKGIRVNGVAPGPVWTALQVSGGATQEKLQKFGDNTPLGRPGQPAELASIYVQLAANDASFATGQIYGSAGGDGQH